MHITHTLLILILSLCRGLVSFNESSMVQDRTYIPDDNFEQAIIDLGFDDILDDYVLTSNINEVGGLGLISKNISDLTNFHYILINQLEISKITLELELQLMLMVKYMILFHQA